MIFSLHPLPWPPTNTVTAGSDGATSRTAGLAQRSPLATASPVAVCIAKRPVGAVRQARLEHLVLAAVCQAFNTDCRKANAVETVFQSIFSSKTGALPLASFLLAPVQHGIPRDKRQNVTMMDFYMTPGSCSTGIHILLEELDLIFSAHIVNLPAGDSTKPAFLAINPKGSIPVLVRPDGVALTEFQAIAWWLALTYPKAKLLPEGADAQGEALDLLSFIVGTIHLQGYTRIFVPERTMFREEDRPRIESQGKQIVLKGFSLISKRLETSTSGYLFDHFTIADAALFYVSFWADRTGLPLPAPCRKHFDLMLTRPKVRQVLMEEGYRP
jgi:glutathione S-transferase